MCKIGYKHGKKLINILTQMYLIGYEDGQKVRLTSNGLDPTGASMHGQKVLFLFYICQ